MKTRMKRVGLHNNLFLSGTNLGTSLDTSRRGGIVMDWDEARRWLEVTYKDESTYVMEASVFNMVPAEEEAHQPEPSEVELPKAPIKAQVSTPTSHVFDTKPGKTKNK